MASLRPTRDRIPTQVFTPSKVNVSVKSYLLNEQKAIGKIVDATIRPTDVDLQYKHGNIILEFTAATYLHFSKTLLQHLEAHTDVTCSIHDKQDKSGKVVEQSIAVKCNQNLRQHYRINLYNTTCRVEVNGRNHHMFFDELQAISKQMDSIKDYSSVNKKIREECIKLQQTSAKKINKTSPPAILNNGASEDQSVTTNTFSKELTVANKNHQDTVNKGTDRSVPDNICPKCNRTLLSRGVFCIKGNHWIHYACEKLKKSEIEELEKESNNIQYTCTICNARDSIPADGNIPTKQTQKVKKLMPVVIPDVASPLSCVSAARAILNEETVIRDQIEDLPQPTEQSHLSLTNRVPITGTRNDISLSDKELRQKEGKLRKMEEELKKEKVTINDALKDQAHLKTYSLSLEAKVKELESSNKILRMKIVGTQHSGSTETMNKQPPPIFQENQPVYTPQHTNSMDTYISSLENNIIKDRITHIENTRQLYRQMHDMELQSIQQRLRTLELTLSQSARPHYQPYHTSHFSMQYPIPQGPAYMARLPTYPHQCRPMSTNWPGQPQHMPAYLPNMQRPIFPSHGLPPHPSNIPPPSYFHHQTMVNNQHNRQPAQQTFTGANLHFRHDNKYNQTVNTDINSTTGPQATNTVNHPHKSVTTTPPTENATSNMATTPTILNSTDTSELLNTVSEIKMSQQELQTEPEEVSSTLHKDQDCTNKVKKSIPDKEVPNVDRNQISQEEHWLFKFEQDNIGELFNKTSWTCKSVDENNPIPPTQKPRGYGGVAILWKQHLDHLVEKINDGSERIICIKINVKPKPILLICAYMPCRGSKQANEQFKECLDQLHEIILKYSDTCTPVLCGDWNCDLMKTTNKSARIKELEDFISSKKLMFKPTPLTFIHPNGNETSTIDYIFVHDSLAEKVYNTIRLDMLSNNTSDHYPLLTEIETEIFDQSRREGDLIDFQKRIIDKGLFH
ncbi:EIF4G [Mytilus edulis]|uniref:EIF4G n=1 Tax=Mytilus edulis TaxID=6550 RepID=A0A8S3UHV3_MYTED|nr:EIF4G [Mytilus edulis]